MTPGIGPLLAAIRGMATGEQNCPDMEHNNLNFAENRPISMMDPTNPVQIAAFGRDRSPHETGKIQGTSNNTALTQSGLILAGHEAL